MSTSNDESVAWREELYRVLLKAISLGGSSVALPLLVLVFVDDNFTLTDWWPPFTLFGILLSLNFQSHRGFTFRTLTMLTCMLGVSWSSLAVIGVDSGPILICFVGLIISTVLASPPLTISLFALSSVFIGVAKDTVAPIEVPGFLTAVAFAGTGFAGLMVIKKIVDDLEARLQQRTNDLETLQLSRAAQNEAERELRLSEQRFQTLFLQAPQAMLLLDETGTVLDTNQQAQSLLRSDNAGIAGQRIHEFLVDQTVDNEALTQWARATQQSELQIPVLARRRDGSVFRAAVGLMTIDDGENRRRILGITDVTRSVEVLDEVQNALEDKELLLREVHHRVKNNMQIVSSLLNMQISRLDGGPTRSVLQECRERIQSMALVHQLLYSADSFRGIEMGQYAQTLTDRLHQLFAPETRFDVRADLAKVAVGTAIPLGMALNELITNAFKYGIPSVERPDGLTGDYDVVVELRAHGSRMTVSVMDSGPGLPDGALPEDAPTTMGLTLLRGLVRQISGTLVYKYDRGSCFSIESPMF